MQNQSRQITFYDQAKKNWSVDRTELILNQEYHSMKSNAFRERRLKRSNQYIINGSGL